VESGEAPTAQRRRAAIQEGREEVSDKVTLDDLLGQPTRVTRFVADLLTAPPLVGGPVEYSEAASVPRTPRRGSCVHCSDRIHERLVGHVPERFEVVHDATGRAECVGVTAAMADEDDEPRCICGEC
jgi:hypothetical protein